MTDPHAFAQRWVADWNAHQLPRILSHYSADCVLHSPAISKVLGTPQTWLQGQDALAHYWGQALARYPQLRFELRAVLQGTDTLLLMYQGLGGREVAELLHFNAQGLVDWARVHYALEGPT